MTLRKLRLLVMVGAGTVLIAGMTGAQKGPKGDRGRSKAHSELDRTLTDRDYHGKRGELNREINRDWTGLHAKEKNTHTALHGKLDKKHVKIHARMNRQHEQWHEKHEGAKNFDKQHVKLHERLDRQHAKEHSKLAKKHDKFHEHR